MFDRVDKYLVVTTDNLRALEEISVWIHRELEATYFIQIESFPNFTLYRVCILLEHLRDRMVTTKLTNYLQSLNIKFIDGKEFCK